MEHRRKLFEHLERYEALLRMTTDAQAIAALEQLIQETVGWLTQPALKPAPALAFR
jgi:hypothetical protein